MTRLRNITALTLSLLCMLGLASCNTIEGAGEDIEAVGDSVEDAADDA